MGLLYVYLYLTVGGGGREISQVKLFQTLYLITNIHIISANNIHIQLIVCYTLIQLTERNRQ